MAYLALREHNYVIGYVIRRLAVNQRHERGYYCFHDPFVLFGILVLIINVGYATFDMILNPVHGVPAKAKVGSTITGLGYATFDMILNPVHGVPAKAKAGNC